MTPHLPEKLSTRLIHCRPFVIMGNTIQPEILMKTKTTRTKRKTTKRRTAPTNRGSCASRTKSKQDASRLGLA